MDDIKPEEWIDARERMAPPRQKAAPKLDAEVSKAVGINVGVGDPRVVKVVAGWRRQNPNESNINNNYLRDPKKVEELRKALQ